MFGFIKKGVKKIGSYVASHVKKIGSGTLKSMVPAPISALYDYINNQPLLKNFSSAAQRFLASNGEGLILKVIVSRTLITNAMHTLLNLITRGDWNNAKQMCAFDKLYHLYMTITYKINGQVKQIILEKNERPQFNQASDRKGAEHIQVPVIGDVTITEMCNNAIKRVGPSRYFVYDAFNRTNQAGNCQRFIDDNLASSKSFSYYQQARAFILQNVSELIRYIPNYTGNVAQAVTSFFSKLKTGFIG